MTGKKKGCLLLLIALAVIVVAAVVVLMLLPGEVRIGAPPEKFLVKAPASEKPAPKIVPGLPPPVETVETTLKPSLFEMRYLLPDDMWQNEVRKQFPTTQSFSGLASVEIRNPRFLHDSDGRYLRAAVDLAAHVTGKKPLDFSGRAEVRMRLRFEPSTRAVYFADGELVDLSFSGEAASVAAGMLPVLKGEIADQLNAFKVLTLPRTGGWLTQTGAALVRDVLVEDGKVTVVVGR